MAPSSAAVVDALAEHEPGADSGFGEPAGYLEARGVRVAARREPILIGPLDNRRRTLVMRQRGAVSVRQKSASSPSLKNCVKTMCP
jgi:hypothetical protein